MALTFVDRLGFVNYIAVSADIVDNKISGADLIGKIIYLTDTGAYKIILADLTLADFHFPSVAP